MKVFNLACEHEHRFEGWFASSEEFDRQLSSGLVECPMCNSKTIHKLPSAPRLNLSHADSPRPVADDKPPTPEQLQAMWMKMAQHIVANTEDVGERFADEARRIHYRESPARGIRGRADRRQAAELEEEGIEVFAFPMPKALKEPLQ